MSKPMDCFSDRTNGKKSKKSHAENSFCMSKLLICNEDEMMAKELGRKPAEGCSKLDAKRMDVVGAPEFSSDEDIKEYVKKLEKLEETNMGEFQSPDSKKTASLMESTVESSYKAEGLIESSSKIKVELLERDMWRSFDSENNEMIVTKSGRRMFPIVRISVRGLVKTESYRVTLDFIPTCQNKWKYVNRQWNIMSRNNNAKISSAYEHPDSPNTGEFWTQNSISFSKVKISNKSEKDRSFKIELLSLCQYWPRINIYQNVDSNYIKIREKIFDCTKFIAVTAYQNDKITNMKILFNPFAKAFQDYRRDKEMNEKEILDLTMDQQYRRQPWQPIKSSEDHHGYEMSNYDRSYSSQDQTEFQSRCVSPDYNYRSQLPSFTTNGYHEPNGYPSYHNSQYQRCYDHNSSKYQASAYRSHPASQITSGASSLRQHSSGNEHWLPLNRQYSDHPRTVRHQI